jgi:hypothetical protein
MRILDKFSSAIGGAVEKAAPAYAAFLEKERIAFLLMFAFFLSFMAFNAVNLDVDSSQKSFFYDDDPVVLRNDEIDANFNAADAMTVFVRTDRSSTEFDRADSVRDPEVLEYITTISSKLSEKGFVDFVMSPAENPSLINEQGTSALILVYADMGDDDAILQSRKEQIEDVVSVTGAPTGILASTGGSPIIFSEVSRLLFQDLISTGLLSLAIIAACIRLFYGSNRMMITNVFLVICILMSIFGAMEILGVPLNIATALIAALTIGIGVDYTLHLQNGFLRESGSRQEIVASTLMKVGPPLSISFLTTFIGFFSLFFAGSAVMESLAIATCLGIVFVFLYNLTLTPLLFLTFGMGEKYFSSSKKPSKIKRAVYSKLYDISSIIGNHTGKYLAVVFVFFLIVASGVAMVKTKMSYSDFIPADNPVVMDLMEQSDAFPGSSNSLSIVVEADDVLEYDVLDAVDRMEKRLRTLEYIESVSSPVDQIKMENNGRIPETRIRMDHPEIGNDLTMMRITVGYGGAPAYDEDVLVAELLPAIQAEFPDSHETYFAGSIAYSVEEREVSQSGSGAVTMFSFALIFVILAIYFRSPLAGFILLIPMALSIIATMGLNGWSGVPFSQITSSIFGIIIGIGIDFSIHIGSELKKILKLGASYRDAADATLEHLAKLLFLTSLTTILGFLSLRIAELSFLRDLGVSLAYGIMFAFFFSVLVLPALMIANEKASGKVGSIFSGIRKKLNI